MVSRSGIVPWHDRHFGPIFHRLFSYTSNPIATERSYTLFLIGLALTSLMVTELSRFTTIQFLAIGHSSVLFHVRICRVSLCPRSARSLSSEFGYYSTRLSLFSAESTGERRSMRLPSWPSSVVVAIFIKWLGKLEKCFFT